MKPKLVTLSGIDCAGKSTQLALLDSALRARGPVVRFWFRPGYSPELDLARKLVRQLRPGALPTARDSAARERAFARPGVSAAWLRMAEADTLLQLGCKVRYWLARGRSVICDRWVTDALIDLDLRFPARPPSDTAMGRLLARVCPTPDLQVVLTVSHEEMLRRMVAKQEPFPDAPNVRDLRFERYQTLAQRPEVWRLDCEQPPGVVHAAIRGKLGLD